jgi:hypothetical protein
VPSLPRTASAAARSAPSARGGNPHSDLRPMPTGRASAARGRQPSRVSARPSPERAGPAEECVALLQQPSTGGTLGRSAHGVLPAWHPGMRSTVVGIHQAVAAEVGASVHGFRPAANRRLVPVFPSLATVPGWSTPRGSLSGSSQTCMFRPIPVRRKTE